jgi:nitrilase
VTDRREYNQVNHDFNVTQRSSQAMGDEFPTVRLAAVQAAPVWMERDATIEKACALIREAGAAGAQLVGFPENFVPGHPNWIYFHPVTSPKAFGFSVELYKNSVEIPSAATDELCRAAAEAGVYVVMGLTERRPNQTGTLFNTQLFIDRHGTIVGKHQKLVPTIGERVVHTGGAGATLRTFPSCEPHRGNSVAHGLRVL